MTEKPPNANVLVIPRCREVMLRFQYNQDHVLMYLYMQNSQKTSESFGVRRKSASMTRADTSNMPRSVYNRPIIDKTSMNLQLTRICKNELL